MCMQCPRLTIVCAYSGSSVIHKVDGRTTLSAGSLLDNLHWHYVTIKRHGRQVNLTVDSQTVTAVCSGEFTQLDLDNQVRQSRVAPLTDSAALNGVTDCPVNCVSVVHRRSNREKHAAPSHHTQFQGLPGECLHQWGQYH